MGDIDDRLRELLDRRRELPGSIAVMETLGEGGDEQALVRARVGHCGTTGSSATGLSCY
jgi:hypothetical protein